MTGGVAPGPTRRAVNPVALDGAAMPRFASEPIDDRFVERLRDVCPIDVSAAERIEASRDWWPLALVWAAAGEAPAIAGAVARPTSTAEVAEVLALCSERAVPATAAGGRSGVCGASVPVHGGVVLDTTGLSGIVAVDDGSLLLDVRAGTFGDDLERALRADYLVTLGHWPQSIELSTVGGWLACRSAGQYSTRYGKIEDIVIGLEVALADGSVVRTGGAAPRSATGPDLTQLFVGSEGTLGVITEARLRVHPVPADERRGAWLFGSFEEGLDACRRVLRRGATPAVLRLYDERESRRSFEVDGCVLVVLDEGDAALVEAVLSIVAAECSSGTRADVEIVQRWLDHRNDVDGLGVAIAQGFVVDTCEVAGRWAALPRLYREAIAAVKQVDGVWVASAHQSHAYSDGACLYFTFAGKRDGDPDGLYRDAWDALSKATLANGAAISHHHGVGINRDRFMAAAMGDALAVFASVKRALDPAGVLNPGKLGLSSPFGPRVWP